MKPIKMYLVHYQANGDLIEEWFPTKKEAKERFYDLKLDQSDIDFDVKWEELILIPPTKRNICHYLHNSHFVLNRKLIDSFEVEDEEQED